MKVLTPGHRYQLANFENSIKHQILQFIQKEVQVPDGTLETISDGTTNEEVLEMLLDRMEFLNKKMPCQENTMVIVKLEACLFLLNKRTKEREKRGVEGTHQA